MLAALLFHGDSLNNGKNSQAFDFIGKIIDFYDSSEVVPGISIKNDLEGIE